MRIALAAFAAMLVASMSWAADQQSPKADASHRRAICGEIKKLDLALYDNAKGHGATATCSYTDDRLLIKPISELSEARMKRFVFLAFVTTGALRNDDYMLPGGIRRVRNPVPSDDYQRRRIGAPLRQIWR